MLPRIMFLLSLIPAAACSLPAQMNYGRDGQTAAAGKDILALAGFETAAGAANKNDPGLGGRPVEKSYVITTSVNMRDGPAIKFEVIRVLRAPQEVILTAEQGDWLQVAVKPAPQSPPISGWIAKEFLKVKG